MIAWGSVVLALLTLIASVLDDRRATRPQRKQDERNEEYDRDIQRQAQAAATGDAATLAQSFEAERLAAIRRGDLQSLPGERLQRP